MRQEWQPNQIGTSTLWQKIVEKTADKIESNLVTGRGLIKIYAHTSDNMGVLMVLDTRKCAGVVSASASVISS